jgi:MFS family permease
MTDATRCHETDRTVQLDSCRVSGRAQRMRIETASFSLLTATGLAVFGNGLLSTVAALRLADSSLPERYAGVILAAYFGGLVVGTVVLPPTIERVGRIRSFTGFAALIVVSALAHGLLPLEVWLVLRFITGLSMAGFHLTVESWLAAGADPAKRGVLLAAYLVALYAGIGVGQLSVPLWPPTGIDAFAIAALTAGLAAVVVSLTPLREPVETTGPTRPVRIRQAAPIAWMGAWVSGFAAGSLYSSFPLMMRTAGLPTAEVSTLLSVAVFGGLALQWPIGALSDATDRRSVLLGVSLALGIACFAAPDLSLVGIGTRLAFTAAFGGLVFSLYPLAAAHALDRVDPAEALGTTSRLLLASAVGSVVGPVVASFASDAFGPFGFFAANGFVLLSLAALIAVRMLRVEAADQVGFRAIPRTSPAVAELDPRVVHPDDEIETSRYSQSLLLETSAGDET